MRMPRLLNLWSNGIGSTKRRAKLSAYSRLRYENGHVVGAKEMAEIRMLANRLTQLTGTVHSVDHIWPLQGEGFCGFTVPWNLQVMPAQADNFKGNTRPDKVDWLKKPTPKPHPNSWKAYRFMGFEIPMKYRYRAWTIGEILGVNR